MKLIVVIFGGLLLASPALAWDIPLPDLDPWSRADIALEAVTVGLFLVDWGQTLDISDRHGESRLYEKNRIIGKEAKRSRVNVYFPLAALVHAGITWVMPAEAEIFGFTVHPRRIWQCGYIGYQCSVVSGNFEAGVRVGF